MTRKLDIGKVEDALKRAARTAISGRREERAGRFISRKVKSPPSWADKKPRKTPKASS